MPGVRPYPVDAETVKISLTDKASNPRLWDQFEFGNPTVLSSLIEDFHYYVPASWTATVVGSGTHAVSATEPNGAILITNSAADDDSVSLQKIGPSFQPAVGRVLWFEARVQISEATQSDLVIGLCSTNTTPLVQVNGIIFRKPDGATNLQFETTNTSVASIDAAVLAAVSAATYITVGFRVTGTSLVEYFLNGQKKGQFTGNIPTVALRPTIHVQNGDANARTGTIDYVAAAQTRIP